MYAQLGNIKFEGLRGFTGQRRDREITFAELPLLDGKARLQRTGSALETLGLELLLHIGFTDPVADLAELAELAENGEVLPFVVGDGSFIGNYVITKLADTINETNRLGVPTSITVSVEIKEFIDPNPTATADASARNNGFATSPLKVVPVRVARTGTTPAAVTSQAVTEAAGASNSAIGDVKKASVDASQQASLLQRAGQALRRAQEVAQTAIDNIQNYASLATTAPNLLATMQGVYSNAALLAGYVASGDLTNALTQSDALAAAVGNSTAAVIPLDGALIQRRL